MAELKDDGKTKLKETLSATIESLINVINAAYKEVPLFVIVFALLSWLTVSVVVRSSTLMTATTILLVLIVSLSVFTARGNFGESILSLVGGLFTIFRFDWTPGKYIAFSGTWIAFSLFALMIASIKTSIRVEDLYRKAAVNYADDLSSVSEIEQKFREFGDSKQNKAIGPIKKAEVISILAVRKLPLDYFPLILSAVETLTVITRVEIQVTTIFLADFFVLFSVESELQGKKTLDALYKAIKDSRVLPEEFFEAFKNSRRLLLSRSANYFMI